MRYLIKNAAVVNEGEINRYDVLIEDELISRIDRDISVDGKVSVIEASHLHLFPGLIDDQVHSGEHGDALQDH